DLHLRTPGGAPCACGVSVDDTRRVVIWAKNTILRQQGKAAVLAELQAARADCGPACALHCASTTPV
ncbi:hypothetical protein, partial [Microbispora triticiradicis]|uniref:hypothetical protein n=1 Tax=Microbispora triticiradicis TaxID=2200763 RepID=UPI001AD68E1A